MRTKKLAATAGQDEGAVGDGLGVPLGEAAGIGNQKILVICIYL